MWDSAGVRLAAYGKKRRPRSAEDHHSFVLTSDPNGSYGWWVKPSLKGDTGRIADSEAAGCLADRWVERPAC